MGDSNDIKSTFTWIIENYPWELAEVGDQYHSSWFFVGNILSFKWYMRLFPNGKDSTDEGFISCELEKSAETSPNGISYKLEILDKSNIIRYSQEFKRRYSDVFCLSFRKTVPINQFRDCMNNATFSLRMHLIVKHSTQGSASECIEKTKFNSRRFLHEWKINAFTGFAEKFFKCDNVVYKTVYYGYNNTFVINITESWEEDNRVSFRFSLLDNSGGIRAVKFVTYIFKKYDDSVVLPIFFQKEILANKEYHDKNNNITLLCEFLRKHYNSSSVTNVEHGTLTRLIKTNPQSQLNEYISQAKVIGDSPSAQSSKPLIEGFQKIYTDKVFSDIEFRIGKEVFSAHKCMLSMNSPVFLAMFSQDMSGKKSGVVEITDVNPEIFDLFLRLFYSGNVDNMENEKALKLLVLADRYDVHSLVAKCTDFLASNISPENAVDVLLTADATHQTRLKNAAVSYIKSHAKRVLKSKQWKQLIASNMELVTEILADLSEDLPNVS